MSLTVEQVTEFRRRSLDERALYFDVDPTQPHTPRTERAVHAALLAELERLPPSAVQQQKVEAARRMRRDATADAAAQGGAERVDTPPRDAGADALGAWAAKHWPERPPSLRLATFEATGRGLTSDTPVAAGDVILRVPERLLLMSDRALAHPRAGAALRARAEAAGVSLHEDALLAVALLLEPVLRPEGAWAEYVPLLPHRPPSALLWSSTQLSRMAATPLPSQAVESRRALRSFWRALLLPLSSDDPELFPPAWFGWPRFLWAYALVESRGMVLDVAGAKSTALVPIADMLNHSAARSQLAHPALRPAASGAPGERALELRALCDVEAGVELFLYYGRMPALQCLQYYGFVEAERLRDEAIQLDIEPPDEDDEDDEGGGGGSGSGDGGCVGSAARPLRERRLALLRRCGLGLAHFISPVGDLSPKLKAALRICVMGGDDLAAAEAASAGADGPAGAMEAIRAGASDEAELNASAGLQAMLESLLEAAAEEGTFAGAPWDEDEEEWAAEDGVERGCEWGRVGEEEEGGGVTDAVGEMRRLHQSIYARGFMLASAWLADAEARVAATGAVRDDDVHEAGSASAGGDADDCAERECKTQRRV